MWILYLQCLVPLAIGTFIFVFSRRVNWLEWLLGTACCFVVAGIVHLASFHSQTSDTETWSGRLTSARKFSAWLEYYEEAIYKTERYKDSNGKSQTRRVFSHWSPRRRHHSEYFECYSNIGTSHTISRYQFEQWVKEWRNIETVPGNRTTSEHASRFLSGDRNDYVTDCPPQITEPVHKTMPVTNRIIAAKSVFSFIELTPEEEKRVFKYPISQDSFTSNRLQGTAMNTVSLREWDCMNARLGTISKVNVILVGFDSDDHYLAELQRSYWKGGKKNDLVLCYGKGWSKVFGWSDSDVLKRTLEDILLKGNVSTDTIKEIEPAILSGYQKTNWHKFDHLSVEPSGAAIAWFWVVIVISQVALYFYFHANEHDSFSGVGFEEIKDAVDSSSLVERMSQAFTLTKDKVSRMFGNGTTKRKARFR